MKMRIKAAGLLLVLLMSMQWAFAMPRVLEASFQRIFDGNDFFEPGKGLELRNSIMSDLGNLVAFYGVGSADGYKPHLFIHYFDSTDEPVEVPLPAEVGSFKRGGLISNSDGSRIFFVADDALDNTYGDFLFCMLDTTTREVTVLLEARPSIVEVPQDIATDAVGNYLYFNEEDNIDQGDLWRIQAVANAVPERVVAAGSVAHPSGGYGRFIDEFDVSDDRNTIAFFIEGRVEGGVKTEYDKELFVKIGAGVPRSLTDDDNEGVSSSKSKLRLSGDGSTIVYSGNETNQSSLMVTTTASNVNEQEQLAEGYETNCNKPGITTDGNMIFTRMTPETVSSPHGFLILSSGEGQLKMDTRYDSSGVVTSCTAEGVHLSGGGNRVFFKARPYVESIGEYVTSLYTGEFNQSPWLWLGNPPWPTEAPMVTHVDYPAPLAFGITNPDDFPPFEVGISVSDPQGVADVARMATQMLRFNGYPDNGGYGPIKVNDPSELSAGLWEASGSSETNWPTPVAPDDYDPLEQEIARFSVKDMDGHVFYRDVILQAAEGGCSGTGPQELNPDDMAEYRDVSCITDGLIETVGEVIVKDGIALYLSGSGVYLNGGLGNFFKVQAGAEVIIR